MNTDKEEGAGKSTRNPRDARDDREAIFRSVRGAMMFAMNFTHGTVKKSSLAEMMGGPTKVGRGLGGLDGAAQAGMIRAELDRILPQRKAIIVGRCASPSIPCDATCRAHCCRGWRENPEWGGAINFLTAYVIEAGVEVGVVSHYRMRRAMVGRYFGLKRNLVEIAQLCGVHKNTASAHNKAIVEHLKKQEQLAMYEVEGLLKEAGVID